MTDLTRRRFLGAMLAVAAAPMIVRASSLMAHVPVRQNILNTAHNAGWRSYTITGTDGLGNLVVEVMSVPPETNGLITRTPFRRIDSITETVAKADDGFSWKAGPRAGTRFPIEVQLGPRHMSFTSPRRQLFVFPS